MAESLEFLCKDFTVDIMNMFKELKEMIFKELKENMVLKNICRKVKTIKICHMEILKLKSVKLN